MIRKSAKPKAPLPTEHQEQATFIQWLTKQHPKLWFFAVLNAAKRSPRLAAYLKAEGMVAGAPDLHIPAMDLYIEFKRRKGGVISAEQQGWADYLEQVGKRHFFAYGCEDAITKFKALEGDGL